MKILPQLQGRARSIVFLVVLLVILAPNAYMFFVSRVPFTGIVCLILLVAALWYAYKAIAGEEA